MNILVIGGFCDDNPELKEGTIQFTKTLGAEIIKQGHVLLNACMTEFDSVLAESANKVLLESGQNPNDRIIGYILDDMKPSHNFGKIRTSELRNWDLSEPGLRTPEPIDQADVVISICGFNGTQRAANWARIAQKPLLPILKFEGASKLIYREEKNNFNKSKKNISLDEFEDLSQTTLNDLDLSKSVINLAERVNLTEDVFVIMSFADDPSLEDAYESFKDACSKFSPKYNCKRMDDITDIKRITPVMFSSIKNSAFVIVDLTFERPNVYYELGYADALDKPIIVTAKKGTVIHFDAKDFPIIFWESQTGLKKDLVGRIEQIAQKQGRVLNKL